MSATRNVTSVRAQVSEEEWTTRVDLAAAYRLPQTLRVGEVEFRVQQGTEQVVRNSVPHLRRSDV